MYVAVDENDVIQAKGSKEAMTRLVKEQNAKGKKWYVGNSPSSKVGDTFGRSPGQQQFEVVSGGRTIAHITAPDAESANLDLARGKQGGWYPADAKIKGYQGRFAAARKRAAPRRDEGQELLQGAEGA